MHTRGDKEMFDVNIKVAQKTQYNQNFIVRKSNFIL